MKFDIYVCVWGGGGIQRKRALLDCPGTATEMAVFLPIYRNPLQPGDDNAGARGTLLFSLCIGSAWFGGSKF